MRRSRLWRTVLTAATQFAAHLKHVALEAAATQDAASVRRSAREYVHVTDVDHNSINLTACVDTLQVCSELEIPPSEKVVQVMSLWLTENLSTLDGDQWHSIAAATSRQRWQFWDETLFKPNESLIRERFPLLSVRAALNLAKHFRDAFPENHFTLRSLFDTVSATDHSTAELLHLVEIYSPLMAFRFALVGRIESVLLNANDFQVFATVTLCAFNCGITDPAVTSAVKKRLLEKGTVAPAEEVSVILRAMASAGVAVDDDVVAVCRQTIKRCKTASEFLSIAEALTLFPRARSTDELLRALQHNVEVQLPDNITDKCMLAKCAAYCGATRAFEDILESVIRQREIPATAVKFLLEGCVVTDKYPIASKLSILIDAVTQSRDSVPLHDLTVAIFAAAASELGNTSAVSSLVATANGRIRLSRSHDPGICPQTIALLLRGCHLLQLGEDVKLMEVLQQKAGELRAGFSVSDCCHLLLVSRGIGATALTKALAAQIRLIIPVVEPAMLPVVAKAFALCQIRDVSAFRAIAERAQVCAAVLDDTSVIEILDAFESAQMEQTLGLECVEAFVEIATQKPADQRRSDLEGELELWATKFCISTTFQPPTDLPTTLKGCVDRLSTFPTSAVLVTFLDLSENATAQEIFAQCKPKRIVNSIMKIAEATLDDAPSKTAIHRLCMAAALTPAHELERYLTEMVATLSSLASRRLAAGSVFRVFGKRICAVVGQLTAAQVISVAEAYAVMRVPDDAVIRALMHRLNDLEPSIKSGSLKLRATDARQAFGHWGRRS